MTNEQMAVWVKEQIEKLESGRHLLLIPTVPSLFSLDKVTGDVTMIREADWNHFTLVIKSWKYDINLS